MPLPSASISRVWGPSASISRVWGARAQFSSGADQEILAPVTVRHGRDEPNWRSKQQGKSDRTN
eukprot:5053962-Amphidinium_carterae.1